MEPEPNEHLEREALDLWLEGFRERGMGWLPVLSGSMRPVLRIGDRIHVRACDPRRLPLGSLVVFRKEGRLAVHRLLAKRASPEGLLLRERGDANPHSSWIPAAAVIGEADRRDRGGRVVRLTGLLRRARALLRAQRLLWRERFADLWREWKGGGDPRDAAGREDGSPAE